MSTIRIVFACAMAFTAVLAGGHHDEQHHDTPAHYKFAYGVHDPHTKDKKDQFEHRDGDHVVGRYSVHEPDGTKRIVDYTSDKHKGFQAVVHKVGHAHHPDKHGHHDGTSHVETTHWGHGSGR